MNIQAIRASEEPVDGIREIPSNSSSMEKLAYTEDTDIYRLSCHESNYVLHIYNNNCQAITTTAQIEAASEAGATASPVTLAAATTSAPTSSKAAPTNKSPKPTSSAAAAAAIKDKYFVVENLEKPKPFTMKQDINILQQQTPVWVKRGSQNNLSNGAIGLSLTGQGLVKKVQNSDPSAQKKAVVRLTHLPERPPVDIEFVDLSYSVFEGHKKGYKKILKDVNGTLRSGTLTAIMGPSGAGKSTLMNILAGYKTSNLSGTVLINKKERNLRRFRKLSCYIMQDDRLLPYLTVREAMMVSANLKLGHDIDLASKKIIVNEIIDTLGLSEAKNTQSINLSGGQRKRLSIALELVNNPPVMLFDEPTSGLDSSSCSQLITLLQSLARGGRTIVCTIHQPSARLFEMFDNLYLLAEGNCIYQGNVTGLVPFLSSLGYNCPSYHNPADYVMEVACGEHGECVQKLVTAVKNGKCNNYNQPPIKDENNEIKAIEAKCRDEYQARLNEDTASSQPKPMNGDMTEGTASAAAQKKDEYAVINMPNQEEKPKDTKVKKELTLPNCETSLLDSSESVITLPNQSSFPTSCGTQFWILLKRTFLSIIRDQTLTHMRFISHVLVGAIIGMIYYDVGNEASKIISNAGCIFFTTLFTMFTAMMPTILTFPAEMAVFVREHLNYWYSLKAFYFAKTIADLPFQILFTSVYVITIYYLTSQPMEPKRVAMFTLICILTSLVAQSLGLLIGAGLSIELGVFLGPVSTIPTILFSGFFVNFDVIPKYLQWVTYVSYVRYGFEGAMVSVYGMQRAKLECSEMYCHFRNPQKFLEEMSMDNSEYWIDATALAGFFVFLRVVAYFVLRWKLHSIR